MKKIVLSTIPKTQFEHDCGRAIKLLEDNGFTILSYQGEGVMSAEEIKAVGGEICAVIAGCAEWPEDVIAACPNLKVIARFGVGVDNIDLAAAKRHGVRVVNARGINSDSVAEQTVMLALAVLRNLVELDRTTREGGWMRYSGRIIRYKTWGFVGFGAVARYVAKILRGFEPARILAYDPYADRAAAEKLGVEIADLDTVLRESDIISVHVPGIRETYHMIDRDEFAKMKPSAILINNSRGSVVSEEALCEALRSGQIAGAGIDVYEKEPVAKDHPFLALPNIVLQPHQAADTAETFDAVGYFDAQVIVDVINGKEPVNWLNP